MGKDSEYKRTVEEEDALDLILKAVDSKFVDTIETMNEYDDIYCNGEDEEPIRISEATMRFLEASFLLWIEEGKYPIETIHFLFDHDQEYLKRMSNIRVFQMAKEEEKKGNLSRIVDEQTGHISWISPENYEKISS